LDRSVFPAEEGSLESPRRQERRRGRVDYARTPRERLRDREVLQPVLEQHIIPRLMNAHRSSLTPPPSDGAAAPSDVAIDTVHVQTLVDMALNGEGHKARDFVIRLRDQGASIETLYLDLLTPAARRIGVLWETDSCDFVLVTLALLRIQQVMYDLSPDFLSNGATPSSRRVVVVPVPGSQHTFGAAMVADFFRREGWDVVSHHDLSRADLVRMVRK